VQPLDPTVTWLDDGRRCEIVGATSTSVREGGGVDRSIDEARNSAFEPWELPSPDGGCALFLEDHDLWLRHLDGTPAVRLTHDGSRDAAYGERPEHGRLAIVEGAPRRPPSAAWAPDGERFVSYRLHQRQVRKLVLERSGSAAGTPRRYTYRCAFPGDPHVPLAELFVYEVASGRSVPVEGRPLIARGHSPIDKGCIWWSSHGRRVYLIDEDRTHRHVRLEAAEAGTGRVRTILEERSQTYIDLDLDRYPPGVRTLASGEVVWYSERDGWAHLYLYDEASGKLIRRLTEGEWRVTHVLDVDERERVVFATGSGREPSFDPYHEALYRIPLDGGPLELLTPEPADHRVSVSPRRSWIVDTYSTVGEPPTTVTRDARGRVTATVARADVGPLTRAGWRPPERFSCLVADGRTEVFGNLYLPSDFDPGRRYPIVESHAPGPSANHAEARFHVDEVAIGLAERGSVVIKIDGRGKPGRSKAFHDFQYGAAFGEAGAIRDSVAVLRQLASTRPWLDLDRVGICGFSSGGFSAIRAMITHPEVYRAAAAVAGNHSQRTITARWGERYIGMPDVDPDANLGYADGDNALHVDRIRGPVLLIHGELDDDVHPDNTRRLGAALRASGRDVEVMIVPERSHDSIWDDRITETIAGFFARSLPLPR
jgi:dienelactone hydrolase